MKGEIMLVGVVRKSQAAQPLSLAIASNSLRPRKRIRSSMRGRRSTPNGPIFGIVKWVVMEMRMSSLAVATVCYSEVVYSISRLYSHV